jgi:5-methylthioadenosine/S-adenosylhomocysteine deaminase
MPPEPKQAHRIFRADYVFTDGAIRGGLALKVAAATGEILEVGKPEALRGPGLLELVHFPGRVLLPGGVNSHSHAFQILLRGRADDAPSFREWVDGHMYPLVLSLDEEDLETAMLLAFADMAQRGITTVGEFFYLHNAGPGASRGAAEFQPLGNRLDALAVRAARRVGLRVALLRSLYDQGEKPAQRRFREKPAESVAHARALAAEFRKDPGVTVLPAPHSLHGAGPEAIAAAAALAAELGTPFHIHLAEQQTDLEVARRRYGATPLRALAGLGLLSERLVAVHACWLDEEELGMLGAARGGIAYNPSANLFLGDGITDLETAVRAGVTVSLGCDGPGGNNGLDLFHEMRLAETLQRVRRLRMGVLAPLAPEDPCVPFTLGTRNGGRNLGLKTGVLAPGYMADFVAVDYEDLSLAPHHGLDTRVFLANLVHAGEVRGHLTDVVVGGEVALRDRRLARISEEEIRERVRRWERRAV